MENEFTIHRGIVYYCQPGTLNNAVGEISETLESEFLFEPYGAAGSWGISELRKLADFLESLPQKEPT